MNLKTKIRRIIIEQSQTKSNFNKIIEYFKGMVPSEYHDNIDKTFEIIKTYILDRNFNVKVLNNCFTGFRGVRTKNTIIICSPTTYESIAEFIYIIFHELRHEIQMSILKQTNPFSGDVEDFEELYKQYWEMEMDAHEFGLEWVKSLKEVLNLPDQYYELSTVVKSYPSLSNLIRTSLVGLHKEIQQMKKMGVEYSDISDLPIVKKHLDKLEDLF